jgi:hypothetical protein
MAWLHRAVLAGLLLAAYLWAWTPARTAWTEQSTALVKRVMSPADTRGSVTARPTTHTLRVNTGDDTVMEYTAPAGVKFLLPAGFLILVVPRRPRFGAFFAGHLLLGSLALALLAGGVAGLPGGLAFSHFVQTYGVDTHSLAVPTLLFVSRPHFP